MKNKLQDYSDYCTTNADFNHSLYKFCKRLTETNMTYTDRFKHIDSVVFAPVKGGQRFVKVKSFENRISTDYDDKGKATKTLVKDTKEVSIVSLKRKRVIYLNRLLGEHLILKVRMQ